MGVDITKVARIVLSHWHADHSGGILSFLRLRLSQAESSSAKNIPRCVVDLHPDRPIARGIAPPGANKVIGRLPADPTFEEIEAEGAVVETSNEGHAVAGDTVWVSGEIPRVTSFETGLPGAVRWKTIGTDSCQGEWVKEEVLRLPCTLSALF